MSLLDDHKELKQAKPPTKKDLLEEAQAWGFNTTEEWVAAMDELEMMDNLDENVAGSRPK